MDPAAAKQQIAERVKQANKFLVTVNANPTVDQLAACIGLTLMLNRMGKHATAVFSGRVPNAIEFLQPEKTITSNTDSLRDFIISLDKNKADKLRYKIEDQFVRIFITPYQTSLSEKDLVFSQGDFNVEAVIALGVTQRTQLDQAITAHGRILHDATVISMNAGLGKAPDIGQINWADPAASSLCEMLVSISESFGTGLIDSQMATSFLTGIVAETQRFSNAKTSPKVMTMSAQLMAAGANQQLIVSKLEPPPPPPSKNPPKPPAPPPKPPAPKKPKPSPGKPEGELDISHDTHKPDGKEIEVSPTEIRIDEQGNLITDEQLNWNKKQAAPGAAAEAAQPEPAAATPPQSPPPAPSPEPPAQAPPMPQAPAPEPAPSQPAPVPQSPPPVSPPLAPVQTSPAPEDSRHAYLEPAASGAAPGAAPTGQPDWAAPYDLVPMDPFAQAGGVDEDAPSGRAAPPPSTPPVDSSVDEIGLAGRTAAPSPGAPAVDNARSAVENAIAGAPFDPAFSPPVQSLNAQPLSPQPVQGEVVSAGGTAPPAMPYSDTPMLVLPTGSTPPPPAAAPPAENLPPPTVAPWTPPEDIPPGAAPPPVPPPLTPSPGVVIPNVPPQL